MAGLHTHAGVDGKHAASNGGHTADHHGHDFAAGHAWQVRLDDERRFGLAHEDVGGAAEAFAAAGAHDALHHPRHALYDFLQNAEVIKQAGNDGNKNNGAANGDTQHEGAGFVEGFLHHFVFGQRAENEVGPFAGKGENVLRRLVGDCVNPIAKDGFGNQDGGDGDLQRHPRQHRAPREFVAPHRDGPRERDESHNAN